MKLLFRLSLRKIKKSLGRFLSILLIVALGVGFFAGLRESAPDILTTLDNYYDNTNLMDFKITSTTGLTTDDIKSLKELEHVDLVVPSYSLDALVSGEAIRVHALLDSINQVTLKEGREILSNDECLADEGYFDLGDTIHLEKLSIDGVLEIIDYKVVGLVDSSLYLSSEKGIATIGNGKLESFIFIPYENFNSEVITEVYLTSKNSKEENSYETSYEDNIQILEDEILELKPIQETKRYEEILEKATKEIQKIEDEFQVEKNKATSKLQKAKKELDSARTELDNGWREYNTSLKLLEENEASGKEKLENAKKELENGKTMYQNTLNQYQVSEENLSSLLENTKNQIANLEAILNNLEETDPNYATIKQNLESLKQLETLYTTLITTKETLQKSEETLIQEEKNYNEQIANGKKALEEAKQELDEGEVSYQNGLREYENGVLELENATREAEEKIEEARQALKEIEKPEWYLLNRTNNNGYTSIYDDAMKIDSIAKVFPVFFILVVALMCFNTLTRMVEEERGEIGILASLGYSKFLIMGSYIFYVFLATIIGVTFGLLGGYTIIPNVVYQIYHANYILPSLEVSIKIIPFLLIVFVSLFIMYMITFLSCQKELKNNPAIIIRPKPPRKGKKVLLERVKFFWKRLSFTSKVTVRNMFRYKKRIVMTVLGIAGSTALLLTGFGLRDSINRLIELQYGSIIHYDALFVMQDSFQEISSEVKENLNTSNVSSYLPIYQESFTFDANNISHDVYVMAFEDVEKINEFLTFNSKSNQEFIFPTDGVVITEKIAKLLKVKIGDFIKIRNSQNELYMLRVSDIVENYTLHYIYMNKATYEKVFEQEISYNMLMANLEDGTNEEELSTKWLEEGLISTINFTSDNLNTFSVMVDSLNKIVYLIIVASCLLAFIVLYNLTTINITERVREISTLKVLGFYDMEVSNYVYRETFMLTLFGLLLGLLLGVSLHSYVMTVAETDNILFFHYINWYSYIFTGLVIMIFGLIVQIFTHFKLKRIDMIESLKSVE